MLLSRFSLFIIRKSTKKTGIVRRKRDRHAFISLFMLIFIDTFLKINPDRAVKSATEYFKGKAMKVILSTIVDSNMTTQVNT